MLYELNRREEAERALLKQIEVAPFERDAYADLAHLRTLQERFKEAAELLERAVAAKPDDAYYLLPLAFARARAGSGDVAGVVARFRASKHSVREDVKAARALAVSGDVPGAARLVEEILPRLISTVSEDTSASLAEGTGDRDLLYVAEAWRIRGMAAQAAGEKDKANRYLTAAWDLGTVPDAAAELGRMREKEGKPEEAIALWQKAAFLMSGRANPARKELERAVKDVAYREALIKTGSSELSKTQVLKLGGPTPPGTMEIRVRLLVDEKGTVLDVVPQAAGDLAKLKPFRERVLAVTLPGRSPDPTPFRAVRSATVSCFVPLGCILGLDLFGDVVARELEY